MQTLTRNCLTDRCTIEFAVFNMLAIISTTMYQLSILHMLNYIANHLSV